MTARDALEGIIRPVLQTSLGPPFDSTKAEVMLLAIGLQESGFRTRVQFAGPARGFWQFEKGGGVYDFVIHGDSRIQAAVAQMGFGIDTEQLYAALGWPEGDQMAVCLARDLLWSLPKPLPALGDEEEAWQQYIDLWRPGKPSRDRWKLVYPQALTAIA